GSTGPAFNYQAVGAIGGTPGSWPDAQMIPIDFNGDGKMDVIVFRPSTSEFAKWYSDGSTGPAFNYQAVGAIGGAPGNWPDAQMIPIAFNGDGKRDVLVCRPRTGASPSCYDVGSTGPAFNYQAVGAIGGTPGSWPDAQMIPIDFNGDGKMD